MSAPQRWAASTLLFLALLAGVWLHGWHTRDDQAVLVAKDKALTDARQALRDFVAETGRLNTIAGKVQAVIGQIETNAARHTTEYRTYVTQHPLPANCRFDDGRMRRIQAAVDDANAAITAAQPSGAVSTDRTAGEH